MTDGGPGWAVDSPAMGAGLSVAPCGDDLRPAAPPPSERPVALTLSGGGFRATLAGLGVIRLLADAGLLSDLRYVSSVSGGSVSHGMLAAAWPAVSKQGHTPAAVDRHVIEPVVAQVSRRSLKVALIRSIWRTVGATTRTDLLARRFDEWFFDGLTLDRLDPGIRWIVNAANLISGVRFGFERDVLGDYTIGLAATAGTGIRLSQAVAASAAVPGLFAPMTLTGVRFPCATTPPVLLDGGTYDNTGIEALNSERYRDVFLVSLNAGGLLRPGPYGSIPLVRDLARANSLLYRQSTTLRTRTMVERFQRGREAPAGPLPPGARRGVLTGLATSFPPDGPAGLRAWRSSFPEVRAHAGRDLALMPTVFDQVDEGLCRALVYRGWWLAGAALAMYHPERLGAFAGWTAPES